MIPKYFNACGYNLSGCTALMDFVEDHEGVAYVNHLKHEIGVLKCKYSFAGALQAIVRDLDYRIGRDELRQSLLGEKHEPEMDKSEKVHMEMRKRVSNLYGSVYSDIVDESLSEIPKNPYEVSDDRLFELYVNAASHWFLGVAKNIPEKHFLDGVKSENPLILLKNDPPGKYPLYASLIPHGVSISVLREPLDACFDFNRFYKRGHSEKMIEDYCNMFGSIVRTAIHHLEKYEDRIKGHFYVVKFEEFVTNSQLREDIQKQFLGGRRRVRTKFNPEVSKKNVGIGYALPEDMKQRIEEMTRYWYKAYERHLRDREMLLTMM